MATTPLAAAARDPLLCLQPGARLRVMGQLSTVRTAVHVKGVDVCWAEYVLHGPHADHWLAAEALPQGSVTLSRWTRTASGSAGFDPERPEAHGVPLVPTDRGEADFTATGDLSVLPGVASAGRLRFVEYTGDGVHASLESLGDAPALLGIRTAVLSPAEVITEATADRKAEQ